MSRLRNRLESWSLGERAERTFLRSSGTLRTGILLGYDVNGAMRRQGAQMRPARSFPRRPHARPEWRFLRRSVAWLVRVLVVVHCVVQ
ncbi:hypothetical protein GCM10027360_42770 [Amycolatopsis echigonensis]